MLYSNWLKAPLAARNAVAAVFGIKRVGNVEVNSNTVVKDGYQLQDIEAALTVENMQGYTGSKEKDSSVLFDLVLAKAQGQEPVVAKVEKEPEQAKDPAFEKNKELDKAQEPAAPKKRAGRPRKNAK